MNVIGLEEVTSYFHYGLAESVAANPLSEKGIATKVDLRPDESLTVNYIIAAAEIPAGFERVEKIEVNADQNAVVLRSGEMKEVKVPIDVKFLSTVVAT